MVIGIKDYFDVLVWE